MFNLTIVLLLLFGFVELSKQDASCKKPNSVQGWTGWIDLDNPTGKGDYEHLSLYRFLYPGKMCANPTDIEARTVLGRSVEETGDKLFQYNKTFGLSCINKEQSNGRCHDYKVRFSCPVQTCQNVCWTDWYNRDLPSGSGDWENLSALRNVNPDVSICADPVYIEAVTVVEEVPALETGQTFHYYSPGNGFVCLNKDQKIGGCMDYKVRFGCHCNHAA